MRHLGNEVTSPRVETVSEAFIEILEQNVPDPPPGSAAIWRQVLEYTGSCFRPLQKERGTGRKGDSGGKGFGESRYQRSSQLRKP